MAVQQHHGPEERRGGIVQTGVRNLIRGGVSQHVAMAISGHRTEAMFRRYNITSDADLGAAALAVTGYVESLPHADKHNSVIKPRGSAA